MAAPPPNSSACPELVEGPVLGQVECPPPPTSHSRGGGNLATPVLRMSNGLSNKTNGGWGRGNAPNPSFRPPSRNLGVGGRGDGAPMSFRGSGPSPPRNGPDLTLSLANRRRIPRRARPLGVAAVGGYKSQQKAARQQGGQHYSTRCLEVPSHLYRRFLRFGANQYITCPRLSLSLVHRFVPLAYPGQ